MDPQQTPPTIDNDSPQTNIPVDTPPQQAVVQHIPHKSKKKYWFIGLAVLILLLIAGFVFGYYLPNKPANAYNTGINRTGYALEKMLNGTTEKENLDSLKKSDISLAIKAKYNDGSYDGSFDVAFDSSKANASLDIASTDTGQNKQLLNAKLLGEIPSGSQYPNLYLQLNGLKSLDIDSYIPGASAYDGQWIAITSDYLKSLGNVPSAEEVNKKTITADDLTELSKAALHVTRDYVFSTDPERAVFENTEFVGKEKVDDLTAFHYKVALNHDHLTEYCKAMIDGVYATSAYKKLPWVDENNLEKDKQVAKSECQKSVDSIDPKTTYDLWVEAKYKLIYKYRVTESKDKDAYTELGQIYKGGEVFTFFANYHDGKNSADVKSSVMVDFKAKSTQGIISIIGGKAGSKYDVQLTLNAKPHQGEVVVEKPAKTVPVDEVLKTLGLDPSNPTVSD